MKTQEQAILDALLGGQVITGSNAYQITKKECACGTLNLHKVLAKIREKGYTINEQWCINSKSNTRFKEFTITNKKQKEKMETKLNSGAIFKNSKKTNEKQPDYQGTVNVNGKEMQISLWFKESQKGTKYFSAAFQEPFKKDSETKTYPNETKYRPKIEDSDSLPF